MNLTDQHIESAIRGATANRLTWLNHHFKEHRDHASFRIVDHVMKRTIGFACYCSGSRSEFQIDIRTTKERFPEVKAFLGHRRVMEKQRQRRYLKASKRSKMLLHKYLSRDQIRTLRGADYFDVVGSDGKRYRIGGGVISLLRDDTGPADDHLPRRIGDTLFCLINDTTETALLPGNDLMLARKLMIESNVEGFKTLANTMVVSDGPSPIDLSIDQLDGPERWVRVLLGGN